jgi:hypothetical protein
MTSKRLGEIIVVTFVLVLLAMPATAGDIDAGLPWQVATIAYEVFEEIL